MYVYTWIIILGARIIYVDRSSSMTNIPRETIMDSTEDVWDDIAESFAETRKQPWRQCLEFISKQSDKTVILDLACGNGRHLLPASKYCHSVIGGDKSKQLLNIAQDLTKEIDNIHLIHLDARCLPLKKESIHAILFVASLHNIAGKNNRLKALKEIKRVLRPGGTALITVWARWQPRWKRYFIKQIFKWTVYLNPKKEFGDILIPWRRNNMDSYRFYHLYSKKELACDIKKAGLKIQKIESICITKKKSHDNHLAIAKK